MARYGGVVAGAFGRSEGICRLRGPVGDSGSLDVGAAVADHHGVARAHAQSLEGQGAGRASCDNKAAGWPRALERRTPRGRRRGGPAWMPCRAHRRRFLEALPVFGADVTRRWPRDACQGLAVCGKQRARLEKTQVTTHEHAGIKALALRPSRLRVTSAAKSGSTPRKCRRCNALADVSRAGVFAIYTAGISRMRGLGWLFRRGGAAATRFRAWPADAAGGEASNGGPASRKPAPARGRGRRDGPPPA